MRGATVSLRMPAAALPTPGDRSLRAILVVAVLVRGASWLSKWNQGLLLNDSLYYSGQARQLVHGHLFRELFVDRPGAEHGPLTSLLMAPVSWGSDPTRWQRLVTVVAGVALVWLLGRLGTLLGGRRVGLVAAGIAALSPNLWMNDGLVMSESISMLLVAAVLWWAVRAAERGDGRTFGILGALLGLGALARSELVLLIVLVVVWLAISRRKAGQPVLPAALPVIGMATLVLLPWVAFNLARFERPVVLTTNDGTTLLGANCDDAYHGGDKGGWTVLCVVADPQYSPDEEPSVRSARQRSLAVQYVRAHWSDTPVVVAARLGRTLDLYGLQDMLHQDVGEERPRWAAWAGIVSFWMSAVLAAIGVGRLARRRRWLLLLPVAVSLTATLVFYGGHRIRSSAEPTLVLLAAFGAVAALDAWRARRPAAA